MSMKETKVPSMSRHATPFPAQHSRSLRMQRWRRRAVVAGAGVALLVLMISYIRYEFVHDLPNPVWATFGPVYSYVPEQGPPSASLLETRPDTLVAQFIIDHIQVAGTFPCVASLADYQGDERGDPVYRKGETCNIHRPVTQVRISLVEIDAALKSIPGRWLPEARVHYQVHYSDGERLDSVMELLPDGGYSQHAHSQPYYSTYIHDTCWSMLLASWGFYANQVQQVPRGLRYLDDSSQWHCAGYD